MSAAHRRLLDMLVGWSGYADRQEGDADASVRAYRREAEAVAELYQTAGRREVMTDTDVEAFVAEHVIPVPLGGTPCEAR